MSNPSDADVRALAEQCAEHADIAGKIFVVPKVESEFRALAAICRELLELRADVRDLVAERDELQEQATGFRRMLDDALNSGDGTYRP